MDGGGKPAPTVSAGDRVQSLELLDGLDGLDELDGLDDDVVAVVVALSEDEVDDESDLPLDDESALEEDELDEVDFPPRESVL